MTSLTFGKDPDPKRFSIDFSPAIPKITSWPGLAESADPATWHLPMDAREQNVLHEAKVARSLISCESCQRLLSRGLRDMCQVCRVEPLERIADYMASRFPDEWIVTGGQNLLSLHSHQMRWLDAEIRRKKASHIVP